MIKIRHYVSSRIANYGTDLPVSTLLDLGSFEIRRNIDFGCWHWSLVNSYWEFSWTWRLSNSLFSFNITFSLFKLVLLVCSLLSELHSEALFTSLNFKFSISFDNEFPFTCVSLFRTPERIFWLLLGLDSLLRSVIAARLNVGYSSSGNLVLLIPDFIWITSLSNVLWSFELTIEPFTICFSTGVLLELPSPL